MNRRPTTDFVNATYSCNNNSTETYGSILNFLLGSDPTYNKIMNTSLDSRSVAGGRNSCSVDYFSVYFQEKSILNK
jgi:hypothetical protein